MSESTVTDTFPFGIEVVYARLTSTVATKDLTAALLEMHQPAVVTVDDWGDQQWAEILLPTDGRAQSLSVEVDTPTLQWRPRPLTALVGAIARQLETDVVWGEDVYDGAGSAAPASDPRLLPGRAESIAWFSKLDAPELFGIVAGAVGRPLAWAKVHGGCVVSESVDPQSTLDSGAWLVESEVMMWTSGTARGAGMFFRQEPYVHLWRGKPLIVDPSEPWHRDAAGLTVAEYSVPLPAHDEHEVWVQRFGLDADRAERLRILFRQQEPTSQSLTLLTEILGIGPTVAEVAEGVTHISELDEFMIVEPATKWQAFRKSMRSGRGKPAGTRWRRFRTTYPRWSMAVVVSVMIFAVGFVTANAIAGDYWGMLLPSLVVAVWSRELFTHRAGT
ncbi:hypothetical protein ABIB15_000877 [Marisediminicola sp. UYEF4]|uniref:hypothetical protein n=1 Tax=Marisediminicola sp. UYEF4 TaxID=1756384 RepID=UPI003398567F